MYVHCQHKNKIVHHSKKAVFGKQHFTEGECMI